MSHNIVQEISGNTPLDASIRPAPAPQLSATAGPQTLQSQMIAGKRLQDGIGAPPPIQPKPRPQDPPPAPPPSAQPKPKGAPQPSSAAGTETSVKTAPDKHIYHELIHNNQLQDQQAVKTAPDKHIYHELIPDNQLQDQQGVKTAPDENIYNEGNNQLQDQQGVTTAKKQGCLGGIRQKWAGMSRRQKCIAIIIVAVIATATFLAIGYGITKKLCSDGTIRDSENIRYCEAIGEPQTATAHITEPIVDEPTYEQSSEATTRVRITFCDDEPCANGGSCLQDAYGYQCKCTAEYTGEACDERIALLPTTVGATSKASIEINTEEVIEVNEKIFTNYTGVGIALGIVIVGLLLAFFIIRPKGGSARHSGIRTVAKKYKRH